MTAMLERLVQWWSALQTRERRMLASGGIVLALLLLYFVAFEPAYIGRQRLQTELPELRAQLAQMEALGTEARQLSAKTGESVESPATSARARQSATTLKSGRPPKNGFSKRRAARTLRTIKRVGRKSDSSAMKARA